MCFRKRTPLATPWRAPDPLSFLQSWTGNLPQTPSGTGLSPRPGQVVKGQTKPNSKKTHQQTFHDIVPGVSRDCADIYRDFLGILFMCLLFPKRKATHKQIWLPIVVADPVLQSARPPTGVSRALRARGVPQGVPERVPENGGVQGSVPRGVPGALRAPGSGVPKKCPESVPRVSGKPWGHSPEHSGQKGPRDPCSWSAGSQSYSKLLSF